MDLLCFFAVTSISGWSSNDYDNNTVHHIERRNKVWREHTMRLGGLHSIYSQGWLFHEEHVRKHTEHYLVVVLIWLSFQVRLLLQ